MLHVRFLEWFPAELVWFQVDHTTSTDSGGGSLLQVGRLKDQVHYITHLNDLTAHQTQLELEETISFVPVREKTNNLGSNQGPTQTGCTVTEAGQKLEISDLESRVIVLSM